MPFDDIWDAANKGDVEEVKILVEGSDLDVNEKSTNGDTLLAVHVIRGITPL